jgi:sulfatase maturation enzyme AslB (radical SAM superfamily)
MFVSINPSYLCNFRCSFCYLTKEQLGDTKKANLDHIAELLVQVQTQIVDPDFIFDLYGGEISLLPDDYVENLLNFLSILTDEPVRITTNLSRIPDYFYRPDVSIAVSYDLNARQSSSEVFANMQILGEKKSYDILMLASQKLLEWHGRDIIFMLDGLRGLRSVEIKPYSANQANKQPVTYKDYENFLIELISIYRTASREYVLQNIPLLESVLKAERSAFSDDHIYITPNAKFAVLEFDKNDREYFLELDDFDSYIRWTQTEKTDAYLNGYCSSCEYFGRCLTEHLREVKDISKSCNGFKGLIDWYAAL